MIFRFANSMVDSLVRTNSMRRSIRRLGYSFNRSIYYIRCSDMERSLKFLAIFLNFFFFIQSANCDNNIYLINSDKTNYVDDEVIYKCKVIIKNQGRIIPAKGIIYNQKK